MPGEPDGTPASRGSAGESVRAVDPALESRGHGGDESSSVAFLHRTLDQVIEQLAGEDHRDDIAAARKVFEDRRGRVFEDEELWERWTQAFLEWYVLERPAGESSAAGDGSGVMSVPAAQVLDEAPAESGDSARHRTRMALRAWLTSHRGVFVIEAMADGAVELRDMLGGGQFRVAEERAMAGVSVGDIAELRLVGFEDQVFFGRTFCFHPAGTGDAIMEHAARIRAEGGSRVDIVDHCASLRIRWERYRRLSPARVYQSSPRDLGRNP